MNSTPMIPLRPNSIPRATASVSCALILIACNTTYDVGDSSGTGGTSGQGGSSAGAGGGGSGGGLLAVGPFPFECARWGQGGKLDIPASRLIHELPARLWLDDSPEAFITVTKMFDTYRGYEGDLFCIVLHVLEDFRAQRSMNAFYHQWLGTRTATPKDLNKYPGFDAARIAALADRTVEFAVDTTLNPAGHYSDLFTAQRPLTFSPDWGTTLPDEKALVRHAAGLLVEPGVLSLHGDREVSPMQRATWVLRTLMCQDLPAPPPDSTLNPPPESVPGESFRERFLRVTHSSPACVSCHLLIDAPGLALDEFDAVGRLLPVDRHGQPFATFEPFTWMVPAAPAGGSDAKFSSLAELGRLLATGPIRTLTTSCFAQRWVSFLSSGAADWPRDSKEVAAIVSTLDTDDRIPHLIAQAWVLLVRTGHLAF